ARVHASGAPPRTGAYSSLRCDSSNSALALRAGVGTIACAACSGVSLAPVLLNSPRQARDAAPQRATQAARMLARGFSRSRTSPFAGGSGAEPCALGGEKPAAAPVTLSTRLVCASATAFCKPTALVDDVPTSRPFELANCASAHA